MAIQALIGIPLLASFITSILSKLFEFFLKFFSKRVAIALVSITAMVSLTVGFFTAIKTIFTQIASVSPPFLNNAASLVVPDNFLACLTIMLSARLLRWGYEWNIKIIALRSQS